MQNSTSDIFAHIVTTTKKKPETYFIRENVFGKKIGKKEIMMGFFGWV